MSRTGENIYKRKDGRWKARYIKAYENIRHNMGICMRQPIGR